MQYETLTETITLTNICSGGIVINANDDLDDYKTAGVFLCEGSAVASTVENSPVTNTGYKLLVIYTSAGTDRFIQIALINTATNPLRYRTYTGAGFSDWRIVQVS